MPNIKVEKYGMRHVGKKFTMEDGTKIKIIDGSLNRRGYNLVEFEEPQGVTMEVQFSNIKAGTFRSPFFKSVCGIGYIGLGKYKPNDTSVCYKLWLGILNRCYSDINKTSYYNKVKVHPEWHNYQNFADWFYNKSNYRGGWQLDKDLLQNKVKDKIYSEDTCVFLPKWLNVLLSNSNLRKDNATGYAGVSKIKNTDKYECYIRDPFTKKQKHIGTFRSALEAKEAYDWYKSKYTEIYKIRAEIDGLNKALIEKIK